MFSWKSPPFDIYIQLSRSGTYIFSETTTDFTLTASHYKCYHNTVNAIVDRVGHGEGCSTTSSYIDATQTNMTTRLPSTRERLGASVNVTCKKSTITNE